MPKKVWFVNKYVPMLCKNWHYKKNFSSKKYFTSIFFCKNTINSYIFWLTFSYIYHFFSRTMATSLGYVLMNWTSTFSKRNKRKKNNIKNNVPPITTKETIGCQTFHVDEGKFLVKMINFRSAFLIHDKNHQLPF